MQINRLEKILKICQENKLEIETSISECYKKSKTTTGKHCVIINDKYSYMGEVLITHTQKNYTFNTNDGYVFFEIQNNDDRPNDSYLETIFRIGIDKIKEEIKELNEWNANHC